MKLVSEDELIAASLQQYNSFIQQEEVVKNTSQANLVNEVGQNISSATEDFMKRHKMEDRISGYNWEYNLIRDETANAFAMPGGKVVIFTGLLEYADQPAELAAIMGHEIAHVVARHGNERVSQALTAQLGGIALSVALSSKTQQTQELLMAAYGAGAQVGVLLPFSRKHESEADEIGLVLMAMAGYDPAKAIDFWEDMQQASSGQAPPEFLSTHPSHQTRIDNIRNEYLPYANRFYERTQE